MSISNTQTNPTLDPVTGIPLDASYATQYQVPLGSQPINLDELNAQGKQSNWLYPDNLPPVVARLQARDLTNPGNAQDLSTDGKRNLNVNINALNPAVNLGGGGSTFITPNNNSGPSNQVEYGAPNTDSMVFNLPTDALLYNVHCAVVIDPQVSGQPPVEGFGFFSIFLQKNGLAVPNWYFGGVPLYYSSTQPLFNVMSGVIDYTFPCGIKPSEMGFTTGELLYLYYDTTMAPVRISGYMSWKE